MEDVGPVLAYRDEHDRWFLNGRLDKFDFRGDCIAGRKVDIDLVGKLYGHSDRHGGDHAGKQHTTTAGQVDEGNSEKHHRGEEERKIIVRAIEVAAADDEVIAVIEEVGERREAQLDDDKPEDRTRKRPEA